MEACPTCPGVAKENGTVPAGLVLYAAMPLRHGRFAQGPGPAGGNGAVGLEDQVKAIRGAGATWMQVVDVDAALGERNQWPQLARLLDGRLRILFGGGVRSMTQVQQLLDLGVERVVVGTQAVRNPLWARELARIFAGHVVLALDARGSALVVQGRTEEHGADVATLAGSLDDAGLAAFLYTDVSGRPDATAVAALRLAAPRTPVIVAGATLADLEMLQEAGAAGAVLAAGLPAAEMAEALRRYPPPPLRPALQVLRAREEIEGGLEEE